MKQFNIIFSNVSINMYVLTIIWIFNKANKVYKDYMNSFFMDWLF